MTSPVTSRDVYGTHWWGTDQDDELLGLLGKCGHFLYHRPDKSRAQERILKFLSLRQEMTQRDLQHRLDVRSASLSEILTKMEAHGLVTRSCNVADKRQRIVRITQAGQSSAQSQSDDADDSRLFEILSDGEQTALKTLLEKLVNHWYAPQKSKEPKISPDQNHRR